MVWKIKRYKNAEGTGGRTHGEEYGVRDHEEAGRRGRGMVTTIYLVLTKMNEVVLVPI